MWPDRWHRLYAAYADAGEETKAVRALEKGVRRCPESHGLREALRVVMGVRLEGEMGEDGEKEIENAKDRENAKVKGKELKLHGVFRSALAEVNGTAKVVGGRVGRRRECMRMGARRKRRRRRRCWQIPSPPQKSLRTACRGRGITSGTERLRANDLFTASNWTGAIEGYTRSIRIAKEAGGQQDRRACSIRSAAWLGRAICIDERLVYEEVIKDPGICIAIDPTWTNAWFRKGCALLDDRKPARASAVFLDGLNSCPGNAMLPDCLEQAEQVIRVEYVETGDDEAASERVLKGGASIPGIAANGKASEAKLKRKTSSRQIGTTRNTRSSPVSK